MCIVEVEGRRGFATSCIQKVEEGMVVHTNTPSVIEARKVVLDLIISNHAKDCLTCTRSGNCELQQLATKFNVQNIEYQGEMSEHKIDDLSPAIVRDFNKCILCRRCVAACKNVQKIGAIDCINRGFESHISTVVFAKLQIFNKCVFLDMLNRNFIRAKQIFNGIIKFKNHHFIRSFQNRRQAVI